MIPKHEDLGNLVTTDTKWYRPIKLNRSEEKWNALEKWCQDNNYYRDVIGYGNIILDGGHMEWAVFENKPYDLIAEENGGAIKVIKHWKGNESIEFANGEEWSGYDWPDVSHLPIETDNEGRCDGIIDMEGNRCNKRQYHENFCATCKKYNDKVKAGKLRECEYCSSTYHATQSCEQNPKMIERNALLEAMILKSKAERKRLDMVKK